MSEDEDGDAEAMCEQLSVELAEERVTISRGIKRCSMEAADAPLFRGLSNAVLALRYEYGVKAFSALIFNEHGGVEGCSGWFDSPAGPPFSCHSLGPCYTS